MYNNKDTHENAKIESFSYNRKGYPAGTEFVYRGGCTPLGERCVKELNNVPVTYMYYCDHHHYFRDNKSNIYTCHDVFFKDHIVQIGAEFVGCTPKEKKRLRKIQKMGRFL